MEIYSIHKIHGHHVNQHGSNFILNKVIRTQDTAQMVCTHLKAGGKIAGHKGAVDQLLIIVSGTGRVRSTSEWIEVSAGDVISWKKGEYHETDSENGMTAFIVESEGLSPERYMTKREGVDE